MCTECGKNNEKTSLGIYVHIPFCVKKCNYCDFLSQEATKQIQEQYCEKLIEEIDYMAQYVKEFEVDSIFIGGGTPSILDAQWIERILQTIYAGYFISGAECEGEGMQESKSVEVTIECNPGTMTADKLDIYKKSGINRISLGLQSANDEELVLLGRIHTWEQFCQSARLVKERFINWNVDVMSALPTQTLTSYQRTLEKVLTYSPTHISAYSLIIEEGTPFYVNYYEDEQLRQLGEKPQILPDEELVSRMDEMTIDLLAKEGYQRYEISNYAKSGYECRHNERYWKRRDYLGFGLGAASCMDEMRFRNTKDIKKYLQQEWEHEKEVPDFDLPIYLQKKSIQEHPMFRWKEEIQSLSTEEQMEETMFLGLRRLQGVDREAFANKFGKSMEEIYGSVIHELELQQLLKYSGNDIQLTQKGLDVSNYVLAQFLL